MPPIDLTLSHMMEQWHDVFLLTGTAAVTLIGLLFVSLSFNMELMLHESRAHLLALARHAFGGFIYAMVVSLFCLEPAWSARRMAVTFVTFGVFQFGFWLRAVFEMRGADHSELGLAHMLRRSFGGLVASLFLVLGGWLSLHDPMTALQTITLAMIFLLASGARSAWDLLIRVGQLRRPVSTEGSRQASALPATLATPTLAAPTTAPPATTLSAHKNADVE